MNLGKITIRDLKVRALIGAYSWEKVNRQELFITIIIEYDAAKSAKSDKLKDALDYETVAAKAVAITQKSRHTLLEKLVAKILDGVMNDKRVMAASVRVDKPQALAEARYVSFELSTQR